MACLGLHWLLQNPTIINPQHPLNSHPESAQGYKSRTKHMDTGHTWWASEENSNNPSWQRDGHTITPTTHAWSFPTECTAGDKDFLCQKWKETLIVSWLGYHHEDKEKWENRYKKTNNFLNFMTVAFRRRVKWSR